MSSSSRKHVGHLRAVEWVWCFKPNTHGAGESRGQEEKAGVRKNGREAENQERDQNKGHIQRARHVRERGLVYMYV